MSDIQVPEGMLRVSTEGVKDLWDARPACWNPSEDKASIAKAAVLAFVEALKENPIVPTHDQAICLCETFEDKGGSRKPDYCDSIRSVAVEWQRRMFHTPEPEVPEEIADLVGRWGKPEDGGLSAPQAELIEAFRRGQNAK